MKALRNLALIAVVGLVLAFVASEARSLWKSLWYRPELSGGNAQASNPYEGLSPEQIGQTLLLTQGCLACHNLDLEGGVLAPSLDNVGLRRNAKWLRQKLLKPHASLPGTYMPSYAQLTDEELEGLVAFLKTLTPKRPSPDNTGTAKIEIPTDDQGRPRFTPQQVERGQQLFRAQGCVGCHTINGLAQGGQLGPNLTHEALRRRSDEWQLRHLMDPLSVYTVGEPPKARWLMPAYGQLSPEDLEALVAFLQSLK